MQRIHACGGRTRSVGWRGGGGAYPGGTSPSPFIEPTVESEQPLHDSYFAGETQQVGFELCEGLGTCIVTLNSWHAAMMVFHAEACWV